MNSTFQFPSVFSPAVTFYCINLIFFIYQVRINSIIQRFFGEIFQDLFQGLILPFYALLRGKRQENIEVITSRGPTFKRHFMLTVMARLKTLIWGNLIRDYRYKRKRTSRVEICRDCHDWRSCKICARCVNFSGKQHLFLHNLRR